MTMKTALGASSPVQNEMMMGLLFSDDEGLRVFMDQHADFQLQSLIETAKKNRVLLRCLLRLKSFKGIVSSRQQTAEIESVEAHENARISNSLALLREVTRRLDDAGFEFLVLKTLDNLPDMGNDVDILIGDGFDKAVETMKQQLGRSKAISGVKAPSICDRLVGKEEFDPEVAKDVSLELYPRISQLGEFYLSTHPIVEGRQETRIGDIVSYTANTEDKILISCVHGLYRHGFYPGVRLAYIYNLSKTLQSEGIRWDYLIAVARNGGFERGLAYYLLLTDSVYRNYAGQDLLGEKERGLLTALCKGLSFASLEFPYRTPARTMVVIFLFKMFTDLRKRRLLSASKVLSVPIMAGLTWATFRILGRNFVW